MGSQITKLLDKDDLDSEIRDPEVGYDSDSSTSWDSSLSSSCENVSDVQCTSEFHTVPSDPYIVEKRFVAGSNEFFYDIIKRK